MHKKTAHDSKSSSSRSRGLFPKLFRLVFSLVILGALILGIVYFTQIVYTIDAEKLISKLDPLLAKFNINIDKEKAGAVAGEFVERISQTNLGSGAKSFRGTGDGVGDSGVVTGGSTSDGVGGGQGDGGGDGEGAPTGVVKFKVCIFSDIHEDLENLSAAGAKCRLAGAEKLFVLGDMTNYGDTAALTTVKLALDKTDLDYFTLPGDHDLAQTGNASNYESIFGPANSVYEFEGVKFLFLDNSANFTPINDSEMSWVKNSLTEVDFVVLSQPLYSGYLGAPFNKIFMGSTKDEITDSAQLAKQKSVLAQRDALLTMLRKSYVKAVLAGDLHMSSTGKDPENDKLRHFTVGAITATLNSYPQKALQSSRFSLLKVYGNGNFVLEDIVL